ncbi:hypothetical protein JRO89_XS06G0252300 [Xanthoceras sorbifolium]|uniref:Uncharacterized protein n=1 Tax=Xanthoceras sorbifolium TaxID=99658 RepID=A0ABQ8HZD7_9ROSI|nr:hypothetical protein JRO89_XS06G0252300 [Xanthoceras sorbifolium]
MVLTVETRKRHLKLYRAAVKGDWEIAKSIFEKYPGDILAKISKVDDTPLHMAAAANRTRFVKELVIHKHMKKDDLATTNKEGKTALCHAAASGNMELVNLMLEKNGELAQIRNGKNMLPIQMAALLGQEQMVLHLYKATKDSLKDDDLIELLVTLINNYLYDAALLLVNNHRQLATLRAGNKETALHALARMPLTSSEVANPNQQGFLKSLFNLCTNMVQNQRMHPKALELVEILWKEVILLDDKQISELIGLPSMLIFVAAEHGNDQFLSKLIDKYPDLIFKVNEHQYSIFHIAVLNRHEKIFNLIYETGSIKDLIVVKLDEKENNILHLAAKLPPPNRLNIVSGAALQLQRELLWFKVNIYTLFLVGLRL